MPIILLVEFIRDGILRSVGVKADEGELLNVVVVPSDANAEGDSSINRLQKVRDG